MEFRDALKGFRDELGLAQTDIAKDLHISIATVGKWETGKTTPSRFVAIALLNYAKCRSTSRECYANLEHVLDNASKNRLLQHKNSLFSVEHSSVSELLEDAYFPVYVCDYETYNILYTNRRTLEMLGMYLDELQKTKCYQSIMHCDGPCKTCHKDKLLDDIFISHDVYRHFDNTFYRVQGKLVQWNVRKAQVRFIIETGGNIDFTLIDDRKVKYQEQLRLHRKYSNDTIAVAHVECRNPKMCVLTAIIATLRENYFSPKDKEIANMIHDRKSLIKLFFQRKTHISVKHCIKDFPQYYEETLDMFQNPTTFDVEAFATLRDITDTAVEDDISDVEVYPREHCVAPDTDRVIEETSLPLIKEKLNTMLVWKVPYSIRQEDKIVHKLTSYSYLDEAYRLIVCVMEDVSDIYNRIKV